MLIDWTIQRTAGPASPPISLDDLKRRLNLPLDYDQHDPKLRELLDAATEQFESDTDRICLAQTFELKLHTFSGDFILLKKRPIDRIESIKYFDDSGVEQTLDSAVYTLSKARRAVQLAFEQSWPGTARGMQDAVTIAFVAGESEVAAVPAIYVQAITMLVGAWFLDPADQAARDPRKTAYDRLLKKLQQEQEI